MKRKYLDSVPLRLIKLFQIKLSIVKIYSSKIKKVKIHFRIYTPYLKSIILSE